nr:hypothetical protein [Luteimonas sp. XNQY3]
MLSLHPVRHDLRARAAVLGAHGVRLRPQILDDVERLIDPPAR